MARGRFLVFEGIDGCGKSSQARQFAQDHDALFTFEPGDSALGAQLRGWLLNASEPMTPSTEALLMLSDRSHHVASVIRPTLESGRDVVSDRYFASTLAYQGYGRGLDLALLQSATDLALAGLEPELTLLLDLPVDLAHERRARDHHDRFESADVEFHERVRAGYLELAASRPDTWVVLDGSGTFDEVRTLIDEACSRHGLWP